MPLEVILPRVDMDMATGKISKWHVKEGEAVRKGAPIFEIETDKAAMEVESPGDGVIHNIAAGEGIDIPVGTPVAFIYGEGEAVSPPPVTASASSRPNTRAPLREDSVTAPSPAMTNGAQHGGLPRATPLARRLARERGIALQAIAGSGPHGRIQADDVKAHRLAQAEANSIAADATIASLYQAGSYDIEPVSGMRSIITERLVQSKQTVPHFYLRLACDLTRLLAARELLNKSAPRGPTGGPVWKLSINDFIIKALALALKQVPSANVTWTEGALLRHRASDVGVAVAIDGGLLTPIIRSAEAKSLSQISLEMKDITAKARARQLLPADYQGGTTTISNLGMYYGIEEFAAIISPPQATILAVGAAIARPAVVKGAVVVRTEMTCTLSCDHRAIDGALGAALLAAFKSLIEEPALMLV